MTGTRTYVIAEAGVNHNGDLELALRLVDAAAAAGADAVKFQSFRADRMASRAAPKAAYQRRATGAAEGQYEMLRRLELDAAAHEALADHCRGRAVDFLSTPFDEDSLRLLVDLVGVECVKLGSGEVTNGPLLLAAASTGRPIILSTGMSTLGEVEAALGVLAFGYTRPEAAPERPAFRAALADPAGRQALEDRVTLLHCTTQYPAPFESVNLRAMDTLKAAFGLSVGLSDHSAGIAVPIAAVARGAVMIEKHLTLDRRLPGPDHAASLEPDEMRAMVDGIRAVEAALGEPAKQPAPGEIENLTVARKSLVAARPIAAGKLLEPADIAVKRPGDGMSPLAYWELLGTVARRDYAPEEPLEP
jgi:N-acetylneuraminate synthase